MRRLWMLPLVPLYAAGAALRWVGVTPKRLGCPVVSIGNLSTGGTGKTPLVIALVQLLKQEGIPVDVLSRGYGRVIQGVAWVNPDGAVETFGDEPLLITREAKVHVYVAPRRWDAGRWAEALGYEPVIHLLDDGFQHRQLYRDVDIVMVNSEDLKDWLLPAGNLREPLSALRRATALAVPVGDDEAVERLRRRGLEQPVWRFRREMTVPEVAGPVVAFCGIARPAQFFAGLRAGGVNVVARHAFRDHHRFVPRDLGMLIEMAKRTGAKTLITTEKDRVRLDSLEGEIKNSLPVVTAGLRIVFEDETGIVAWLRNALGRSV